MSKGGQTLNFNRLLLVIVQDQDATLWQPPSRCSRLYSRWLVMYRKQMYDRIQGKTLSFSPGSPAWSMACTYLCGAFATVLLVCSVLNHRLVFVALEIVLRGLHHTIDRGRNLLYLPCVFFLVVRAMDKTASTACCPFLLMMKSSPGSP